MNVNVFIHIRSCVYIYQEVLSMYDVCIYMYVCIYIRSLVSTVSDRHYAKFN